MMTEYRNVWQILAHEKEYSRIPLLTNTSTETLPSRNRPNNMSIRYHDPTDIIKNHTRRPPVASRERDHVVQQ